jgi:hypothetical protein
MYQRFSTKLVSTGIELICDIMFVIESPHPVSYWMHMEMEGQRLVVAILWLDSAIC